MVVKANWPIIGMTLEEAADALRVDRKTIFKAIQDGGLPARKVGVGWRIDPDAVRTWIATGNAVQAKESNEE